MESLVSGSVAFQDQADAAIRDYCGWHIAPAVTEVLELFGTGTPLLALPSLKVSAVVSVLERGVAVLDGSAAFDGRGYQLRPGGLLLRLGGVWLGPVVVELTHGYDEVPPAVVGVATDLAGRLQLGAAGGVVTSGGYALSGLNQGLDALFTAGSYEATVLDHYRVANLS